MAAAILTVRYLGASGRLYAINAYANDTSNNLIRFDESKVAVAGSPDAYQTKESGSLVDIAFISDLATPTSVQILRNGTPTGDILDVTSQLCSVTDRPSPRTPFFAADKIQLMQIA